MCKAVSGGVERGGLKPLPPTPADQPSWGQASTATSPTPARGVSGASLSSGVLRWPRGAAGTLWGQEPLLERDCSPQAGTGSPQVCLCHQNKHLLRANVLQAAKAQLSQIRGGGRMGENLLPELLNASAAPASTPIKGTRITQPLRDLRSKSQGTTGIAPSYSPAT